MSNWSNRVPGPRELLDVRISEPFVIDAIQLYHTRDPQPSRKLLELQLTGGSEKD